MTELRTLLRLELRSLYGINKFLHTRDRKEKNRCRLLLGAWILVVLMVFGYVGGLVFGLCTLGLSAIVPAYLTVIASFLILAFGIFTAGNRLFGQKGYDILVSMPIRTRSIVLSRFLSQYVEDLLFALAVMLPGLGVYGVSQKPGPVFYLTALVGTLFIPAIPLVIAALLGAAVLAISSRMRGKSMVQTVLMVLLVVGVLLGSFSLEGLAGNMSPEAFASLAQTLGSILEQVYPPAMWLNRALIQGSAASLGVYILISAAVMAFAVFLVSVSFHGIQRRLGSFRAKHNYQIGVLESRGLLKALYIREAKRYFSSSIYVTNTIIGPIMGAMMSIALCVTGAEKIQAAFPSDVDIPGLIPFVLGAIFSVMPTTATSISMEGKHFWAVKALPIPTKTLLDSKILLNLSLMLPFYGVSLVALGIGLKPDLWQLLWLVLLSAGLMLFCVVFGITVNLKFHSFDWAREETVVKQSLPAALGGFAGVLLAAILAFGIVQVPARYENLAKALFCLVIVLVTAILYQRNNKACLADL